MRRVPDTGIIGAVAMREAASTELGQIVDLVRTAIRASNRANGGDYVEIDSIFTDRAVIISDGRYFSYPYTVGDDNTITLGTPTEVLLDYKAVVLREATNEPVGAREAEAAGVFIEALAADVSAAPRYLVRVIKAGTSINNVNYPAAVLREAVKLFDGIRVFVKSDIEHVNGDAKAKDFRALIGRLTKPRFVEANGGEIQAELDVFESDPVAAKLKEAVARGMTNLFGLSIDAEGKAKKRGALREAVSMTKVSSVDLIVEPGAGGAVMSFTESVHHQESDAMRQKMLRFIESKNPTRAAELADADDEAVITAYKEAVAGDLSTAVVAGATPADVASAIRLVEARADARSTIAAAALPQAAKDKLVSRFREAASIGADDVANAIKAEREYLISMTEGAQIRGLGTTVEAGDDQADKTAQRFDALFDRNQSAGSFREAYVDITGDRQVTGIFANCDRTRLREAVADMDMREAVSSTTFGNILGDSITRAMIREYGALEAYNDWRWLCDVVPVTDFRTNERARMGGYGNLPAVAQDGPYNALTTPTDEKATYAVTKRGGTETVSLEAIANDDVGLLRRIPMSLATAAGRTLYEFVYNFLASNAAIYDAKALFHVDHANLGSAALADASFAAARLAMKKQTEKDSLKRLGLTLRHVVVPSDLEETAFNMFVRNTNNDETFTQSRKPTVHVVDYWTDTNNWFATTDNAQVPLIEVGFYGGEEPSLFVQDNPTQGSLFSNDQIKYKIRHIYSGAVRDWRGFYGAIVA